MGSYCFFEKHRTNGFALTQCTPYNVSHATLQEYCQWTVLFVHRKSSPTFIDLLCMRHNVPGWPPHMPGFMRGGRKEGPDRLALAKRSRVSARSCARSVGCFIVCYVSSFFGRFDCAVLHLPRKRRDIGINVRGSLCKACYFFTTDEFLVEISLL